MTRTTLLSRQPSRRNRRDAAAHISAGSTLAAVEALQDPKRETFTRAQVAYLIDLAFRTGVQHRNTYDRAEMIAEWNAHASPQSIRERRIAGEMRQYEIKAAARRQIESEWSVPTHTFEQVRDWDASDWMRNRPAVRRSRQLLNLDEPWPDVAVPGGSA
jgi:hypothetical protein